jgi:hypothetical protein
MNVIKNEVSTNRVHPSLGSLFASGLFLSVSVWAGLIKTQKRTFKCHPDNFLETPLLLVCGVGISQPVVLVSKLTDKGIRSYL